MWIHPKYFMIGEIPIREMLDVEKVRQRGREMNKRRQEQRKARMAAKKSDAEPPAPAAAESPMSVAPATTAPGGKEDL